MIMMATAVGKIMWGNAKINHRCNSEVKCIFEKLKCILAYMYIIYKF